MAKIRKVKSVEEEELEEKQKTKSKKTEGPPNYKFRYLASIQDAKNPNLFTDFCEDNNLVKLKKKVEDEISNALKDEGLEIGALIEDRNSLICFYRYNLNPRPKFYFDRRGQRVLENKEEIKTRKKTWIKEE